MNERIKTLYTEACKDLDITQDILQKFAELIITKCAVVASRCEANGTKNVGAEILEHFGVE